MLKSENNITYKMWPEKQNEQPQIKPNIQAGDRVCIGNKTFIINDNFNSNVHSDKLEQKMKFKKIKIGSKFSRHAFGEVVGIKNDIIDIKNQSGQVWSVSANVIEAEFDFAEIFIDELKLTSTELAEVFKNNSNVIMTVSFNKKLDEKTLEQKILDLYPNKKGKLLSENEFVESVKNCITNTLHGEERIMIGYHKGNIDILGRMQFFDMEIKEGATLRLVDPRTINYIILRNVKYVLK